MKKKDFHILLSYPEEFPDNFADIVTKDLKTEGLKLIIERKSNLPYASLEWAIPGLIVAFVAKSYFASFLSEAGKDHYNLEMA